MWMCACYRVDEEPFVEQDQEFEEPEQCFVEEGKCPKTHYLSFFTLKTYFPAQPYLLNLRMSSYFWLIYLIHLGFGM